MIGSYLDTDGQMDRYNQRKTLGYAVIDADLTPDTQLSVGYDYQQKRANGATWGGFPMLYSDGSRTGYDESFNASPKWTYWDTTSKRAFATLQHAFSNGWKFKVGATHDETKADDKLFYPAYNDWTTGASNFDKTTGAGISPSAGFYNTERKVTGVDGYVDGPFQLFYRAPVHGRPELQQARVRQLRRLPGRRCRPDLGSVRKLSELDRQHQRAELEPAGTGQRGHHHPEGRLRYARLSLADPLKLIIGARYTDWKSEGEGADRAHKVTTPYAGLVFDINGTYSTYASYTEIFQPQTLKDRNGSYLDPVDGKSYEVGVKGHGSTTA